MARGAPKGNQFAKGNSGGGRKTARVEFEAAKAFAAMLSDMVDVNEVAAKIKSGRYSPMDRARFMALIGDKVILPKVIDKVVPNAERAKDPTTVVNVVTPILGGLSVKKE